MHGMKIHVAFKEVGYDERYDDDRELWSYFPDTWLSRTKNRLFRIIII